MTYNAYSYPSPNLQFISDLVDFLVKTAGIHHKTGLSIGPGTGLHEKALGAYCEVAVLGDWEYNAEEDEIPYSTETFDFVFIKSVIEHVRNTDWFLSEIRRVLKPDGVVIVLAPDYQKQKDFFYDDYTHVKPFTLKSLGMALELNGFTIKKLKHFWYYRAIWEGKMIPNCLPARVGYWLTQTTGIKYFRWGADRQLFAIAEAGEDAE